MNRQERRRQHKEKDRREKNEEEKRYEVEREQDRLPVRSVSLFVIGVVLTLAVILTWTWLL